ncbi:hypothetical protein GCM10023080_020540 [Streptomyces pseudoechinosporeus]
MPDLEEVASTRDMDSSFPTAFVAGNKVKPELTSKVIKVLQQANDWRAQHPQEAITESAKMLKLDESQVKADAANVEVLPTAELVAKTKNGTVDKWLNSVSGTLWVPVDFRLFGRGVAVCRHGGVRTSG